MEGAESTTPTYTYEGRSLLWLGAATAIRGHASPFPHALLYEVRATGCFGEGIYSNTNNVNKGTDADGLQTERQDSQLIRVCYST